MYCVYYIVCVLLDKKSPQKKTPKERVAVKYSFTFITHPRAVTGLVWRKTSVYMRRCGYNIIIMVEYIIYIPKIL